MKIIILGAGRVGESVADSLVSERNGVGWWAAASSLPCWPRPGRAIPIC